MLFMLSTINLHGLHHWERIDGKAGSPSTWIPQFIQSCPREEAGGERGQQTPLLRELTENQAEGAAKACSKPDMEWVPTGGSITAACWKKKSGGHGKLPVA